MRTPPRWLLGPLKCPEHAYYFRALAAAFLSILVSLGMLQGGALAGSPVRVDQVTGMPACEVMELALRNTGWPADLIPTMVAISKAEAGCMRNAVYSTRSELSVGPLQINLRAHRTVSWACATQYHCSARVALGIYQAQGLKAWSTYSTRRYRAHLAMAIQIVSSRMAKMVRRNP